MADNETKLPGGWRFEGGYWTSADGRIEFSVDKDGDVEAHLQTPSGWACVPGTIIQGIARSMRPKPEWDDGDHLKYVRVGRLEARVWQGRRGMQVFNVSRRLNDSGTSVRILVEGYDESVDEAKARAWACLLALAEEGT